MKFLLLFLLCCCITFLSYSQITSSFDTDADSWTVSDLNNSTTATVTYNASAGNPGGFISSTVASSQPYYWNAPAKFMGNRAYSSFGENLKFDLQVSTVTSQTHSGNGDLILSNGNNSIYLNLSSFPVQATGWSSYTIKLDETTPWRQNGIGGSLATREYITLVLTNLTAIRIHVQYKFAAGVTGGIDNVVLETHAAAAQPPIITSFTPLKGLPGSEITINGSNFGTTIANNAVYFGGVKATITTASATQLKVTVPQGASLSTINVTNLTTQLSRMSAREFIPVFSNGADGTLLRSSLADRVDYNSSVSYMTTGDIDGDGKVDIVSTNGGTVSILRNTSTTGVIDANSLAPRLDLTPSAAYQYSEIILSDLDSDGKLDIITTIRDSPDAGRMVVLRNISTPGSITAASFDPFLEFTLPPYTAFAAFAADLDGDGRPELVSWGSSCAANPVYVLQNISTPGNIMFTSSFSFSGIYSCGSRYAAADFDGDGKLDLIESQVGGNFGGNIAIFYNTSTPGTLNFNPYFTLNASINNVVTSDLDNDGKPDLLYGNIVRKNIATQGSLSAASFDGETILDTDLNVPGMVRVADMNGDGRPDVISGSNNYLAVYENTGVDGLINSSTFRKSVLYETNGAPSAVQVTDMDSDGKPDIIVNGSSVISIFKNIVSIAPTISNIDPVSAQVGSPITITGTNFSTTTSDNLVYFGPVKATVTNATATSLIVNVPSGAGHGSVSVTINGLTAQSTQFFTPTFSGGSDFNASSFAAAFEITTTVTSDGLIASDLDSDGKIDIASDNNNASIALLHNAGADGVINNTTFDALVNFTASSIAHLDAFDLNGEGLKDFITINNAFRNISNPSLSNPITFDAAVSLVNGVVNRFSNPADINHDGRLDVIFTPTSGAGVYIQENLSKSGAFVSGSPFYSLGSPVGFTKGATAGFAVTADFDGDGFADIAATNPSTDNLSVLKNNGIANLITTAAFSSHTLITTGDSPNGIAAADFDNDGKIDLAVGNAGTSNTISIFRNTSSIGSITFTRQDFTAALGPQKIVAADMDGDGKVDLVVINTGSGANSFSVLRNKSTSGILNASSFAAKVDYAIGSAPRGLVVADIDRDLRPDVIVTRATTNISIFKNLQTVGPIISLTQQPSGKTGCEGSSVTYNVTASGASNLTYQWQVFNTNTSAYENITNNTTYSGSTTATLTVAGISLALDGAKYRCKVSGSNAADVYSNEATLTFAIAPAAPTTTGATSCKAASVTLTASGSTDGNYRWFTTSSATQPINGESNSTFATPTLLATTTFYAAIVNAQGCLSTKTAAIGTINPLPKPTITSNTTTVCGNAATLSGPSNFAAYHWSNGGTTQSISVSVVGSYSLSVEDANGCVSLASDPIVISSGSLAKPIVSITGSPQLCSATDKVTLTGPAGMSEYKWSNGETTSSINVTSAGNYSLIVKNITGCESVSSDVIEVKQGASKPLISVADDFLVSTPAVSYQWFYGGNAIPGDEGKKQFLPFNPFQYGVYKVSIKDEAGCSSESDEYINLVTATEATQKTMHVFPNPFTNELHITSPEVTKAELYDVTGKKIKSLFFGTNQVEDLGAGFYILKTKTTNEYITIKLFKQ